MELPSFSLIFFLSGLIVSLFTGIFQNSTFEDLNFETKSQRSFRILFDEKNLVIASLAIFEFLCYILSIIILTAFFIIYNATSVAWLFLIFLLFVGYSLRMIIFSIGKITSPKLINFLFPSIKALYFLTKLFGRYHFWIQYRLIKKTSPELSLEDIQEIVENAHEEGSIDIEEYKILSNAIRFNKVTVSDVMTPRTVIFACNANLTVKETLNLPETKMFSRFPIYEGKSIEDKVIGYVITKDIFQAALNNELNKKLKEFSREIHFIPENVTLDVALNHFLSKRQHIFLIVNEYGGVEGLLTMEDIIETILGVEIIDEADKYIDLRELAKIRREKRIQAKIYKNY